MATLVFKSIKADSVAVLAGELLNSTIESDFGKTVGDMVQRSAITTEGLALCVWDAHLPDRRRVTAQDRHCDIKLSNVWRGYILRFNIAVCSEPIGSDQMI